METNKTFFVAPIFLGRPETLILPEESAQTVLSGGQGG